MFWLKFIKGLVESFHGDVSPRQLAAGFAMGAMIGLVPKVSLLGLLLWMAVLFFRVNVGMVAAATLIFAIVGAITDPLVEKLGFLLLTGFPVLKPFWTFLYNQPIVPFTAFNNTLVLGNFVAGLILWLPVYLGFQAFVVVYRTRYRERVNQWKLIQFFKASSVVDLFGRWWNR